jgi:hypothetical protein
LTCGERVSLQVAAGKTYLLKLLVNSAQGELQSVRYQIRIDGYP